MPSSPLYLSAWLLPLSLPGLAQPSAATPAAPPRCYVGLAAYHSNYESLRLRPWRLGDSRFRLPVQLTAGYRVRPRLALELGLAYGRLGVAGSSSAGPGAIPDYTVWTRTTHTAAGSALARYALRRAAPRLQLEALGGLTWVHSASLEQQSTTYPAPGSPRPPQTFYSRYASASDDWLLTAGLGLRYRLSARLALNFDFTTTYHLGNSAPYVRRPGSAALGLRYGFGHG